MKRIGELTSQRSIQRTLIKHQILFNHNQENVHQLWGEFHFSSRQLRVTSCIHSLDLPSVGLFPSGHRILVSFISRQRLLLPQALYMLGSTRPTFTTLTGNRCSISTVGRYRSPSLKITRPDAPLKLVCWRKVFNSL